MRMLLFASPVSLFGLSPSLRLWAHGRQVDACGTGDEQDCRQPERRRDGDPAQQDTSRKRAREHCQDRDQSPTGIRASAVMIRLPSELCTRNGYRA